jgi:DNA gyrase subunit A
VNIISRNTQGVRLMRVDEGTRVVSVEIVPHAEEEEAVEGEAEQAEPETAEAEAGAPEQVNE